MVFEFPSPHLTSWGSGGSTREPKVSWCVSGPRPPAQTSVQKIDMHEGWSIFLYSHWVTRGGKRLLDKRLSEVTVEMRTEDVVRGHRSVAGGERALLRRRPSDWRTWGRGGREGHSQERASALFNVEHGGSLPGRGAQEWKSPQEASPHPSPRTSHRAPPWVRRGEGMLLRREVPSTGEVSSGGGWTKGSKPSRCRSGRGSRRHVLVLGVTSVGGCSGFSTFRVVRAAWRVRARAPVPVRPGWVGALPPTHCMCSGI